jgi:hypothetical protein
MSTSTRSTTARIGPRWVIRVLALLMVAVPGLVLSPAFAQAATCGITWGSLPKTATATAGRGVAETTIRNVRVGEQPCYDRLVVDLSGKVRAASVRYVPQVLSDASGAVVALRGGARLQIVVDAPAYNVAGHSTYQPRTPSQVVNVTGYKTFRQVAWAGSFEGTTTLGLGVRARLPMRVFLLDGPGGGSRVVIDVANRW